MINNIFDGLSSEKVFKYFEEISGIPRGSGKTEKISEYCKNFAEKRNLDHIKDELGNIIIFKPSTNIDSVEPIIIQGHLDMVWEKEKDCDFDFETSGLNIYTDDDYIKAKGTTLGGDDGIAVAMCLALLDSNDIKHPPLEIVFTVDEETGMEGAVGIDTSVLKAKRMINLDSEAEGVLWVSCAGGARVDISHEMQLKENSSNCYKIEISGLHGGHSGTEINMGYANSNILAFNLLNELKNKCNFRLVKIAGGLMDNAITRNTEIIIASDDDLSYIKENSEIIFFDISEKYRSADPQMKISVEKTDNAEVSFNSESTSSALEFFCKLPNGVISMSKEMKGLVETSLNLGSLLTEKNFVSLTFSVRSSVNSEKDKLIDRLKDICNEYEADVAVRSAYPAWEYKKDSALRDIMAETYREMYGKDMTVTAIHAGLECGIFCGKISGLDCVSLGPDIFDIHTPYERLSISSVERVWNYILRVLEKL